MFAPDLHYESPTSGFFAFRYLPIVWVGMFVFCSQTTTADEAFSNGPINARRTPVNQLIRLKLLEGKITVRRDWKSETFSEQQDELDRRVKNLVAKGMDDATAERLARRGFRSRQLNPLAKLFSDVAGTERQMSARTNATTTQIRAEFATQTVRAKILQNESAFEFSLTETIEPKRMFSIKQNHQFQFRYAGRDFDIVLQQLTDQSVRLSIKRGEQANVYNADGYEALMQKHPQAVKAELIPVFEHLGIGLPLTIESMLVKNAVRQRLVGIHSLSNHEFLELLSRLDSKDFNLRESATTQLQEERDKWAPLIKKELSKQNSAEVRYRLRSVLRGGLSKSDIDGIIDDKQLLESAAYLVSLLHGSDKQQFTAISLQLEKLTGHRANSTREWKAWLKNRDEQ